MATLEERLKNLQAQVDRKKKKEELKKQRAAIDSQLAALRRKAK